MKYYFDESGNFRPDDDGTQRTGIVVGITVPETAEKEIFAKYDAFVSTLSPSAFNKKGEPKGNQLNHDERTRFAEMVADDNRIVVTLAILDIASTNRAKIDVREKMAERLRSLAGQAVHQELRDETNLLASQFKNLSGNQALRLGTIVYCMKRAFEQSIILLSGKRYDPCWESFRFEIDPADTRPDGREQTVFKHVMLGWLQGWSVKSPTMTITEIHTADHPLIKKFSNAEDKFDLNKIYKGNIHYPDSGSSKGLQLADMSATIVSRAVNGLALPENLGNYGLLLKNNLWSASHAHGLFCVTGDTSHVDPRRYAALNEAVARVKRGDPWEKVSARD